MEKVGVTNLIAFVIYLLDPFNKGYLFGYFLIISMLFNGKKIITYLDKDFIFIGLFSITYALFYIFYMESGLQFIFIYAFFPSFFYLFGKYLVIPNIKSGSLVLIFFTIGFIFSLSALTSIIINLKEGGFSQLNREIPMFWSGKPMKATLMAAYLTFNMCIPIIYIIKQKKNQLLINLIAGLIFIASLLSSFRLGSRTQLVICILSIMISFIYVIPRQSFKANVKLFLIVLATSVLILKFIPLDLNASYLSVLGSRLQESGNVSSAGGRTTLWTNALENLFDYPLGWQGNNVRYAHNLWLDVARYAGLIPFTLLMIFTFRSLRNTLKAIRKNSKELLVNTTLIVFTLASMLIFFVEPIMEGLFFLFTVFCVFQGMINSYLKTHTV